MALLDTMQQALEPYFDLDFLDPLSAPRKKRTEIIIQPILQNCSHP